MSNPRLSFGEMTVFGELARGGVHPADEIGMAMALALGKPDPPHPPFATVPVLLDGHEIGRLERIDFVWGGSVYQFTSLSGNTSISCSTSDGVLQGLEDLLDLSR